MGETIRQAIEALAIEHKASTVGRVVTASLGSATVIPTKDEPINTDELLSNADKALYTAKHGGRNQIQSFEVLSAQFDAQSSAS